MAVPTYQMIMLPVLQEVAGAEQRAVSEIVGGIESRFQLSTEDREQMLPSGTQRTIVNRVHWAVSYMVQAGLIQRVGRGLVQVTERGREVLARPPAHIDVKFLGQYPVPGVSKQGQVQDHIDRDRGESGNPRRDT